MADQRILATENMIGANHPTLSDTLNRLTVVEHNNDGTHKAFIATLLGVKDTKTALAASDINLALGCIFTKTISGATVLTVSNVPTTGLGGSFLLDLTNGGSASVTWWAGVKWAGGLAPVLTASGRDALGFYTYDGGNTWTGLVLGRDLK